MPLLFAANMLVNTDDGDTYSFEEIQGWLTEAALRTHVFWNPRAVPADSRDEAVEGQPPWPTQNGRAEKNSSKRWHVFRGGKTWCQSTTFTTQFTTTSPQKTTTCTPLFPKTPAKTPLHHPHKNYGRYFAGMGLAGDSESQKMFTTQ